ncbi:hypothetical protein ABT116_17050 [Streptomyces sp. NPDC002130]|uniref:hypothetical protein n=1 Tax=Streptomyces sp. NPDC002130 TaxID=3155568 RepID=UPI003317538B
MLWVRRRWAGPWRWAGGHVSRAVLRESELLPTGPLWVLRGLRWAGLWQEGPVAILAGGAA